jgi:hypothetical protein
MTGTKLPPASVARRRPASHGRASGRQDARRPGNVASCPGSLAGAVCAGCRCLPGRRCAAGRFPAGWAMASMTTRLCRGHRTAWRSCPNWQSSNAGAARGAGMTCPILRAALRSITSFPEFTEVRTAAGIFSSCTRSAIRQRAKRSRPAPGGYVCPAGNAPARRRGPRPGAGRGQEPHRVLPRGQGPRCHQGSGGRDPTLLTAWPAALCRPSPVHARPVAPPG